MTNVEDLKTIDVFFRGIVALFTIIVGAIGWRGLVHLVKFSQWTGRIEERTEHVVEKVDGLCDDVSEIKDAIGENTKDISHVKTEMGHVKKEIVSFRKENADDHTKIRKECKT